MLTTKGGTNCQSLQGCYVGWPICCDKAKVNWQYPHAKENTNGSSRYDFKVHERWFKLEEDYDGGEIALHMTYNILIQHYHHHHQLHLDHGIVCRRHPACVLYCLHAHRFVDVPQILKEGSRIHCTPELQLHLAMLFIIQMWNESTTPSWIAIINYSRITESVKTLSCLNPALLIWDSWQKRHLYKWIMWFSVGTPWNGASPAIRVMLYFLIW